MNKTLIEFAKNNLKENLARCTEAEQHRFKQMYSHKNLEANINDVVDNMPEDRLDWAMQQVQRSVDKKLYAAIDHHNPT